MQGFTKCNKGHYYKEELKHCPYCSDKNEATKMEISSENDATQIATEENDDGKTKIIGGFVSPSVPFSSEGNTVFGEEVIREINGRVETETEYRNSRKLVGWLVSYSFNEMGMDFRLYEGRNLIGRDMTCNITVNDGMISGKHAVILFRNNKYVIRDELSTHGTWVNDKDIENEAVELHDGDLIRIGETIFKFKSSL
ncbi:MAG: FHA domain-containing protein [Bacteroidales bacterium]|jgi:hypothetical protein|nr:FHA domain-containing protein [Bacteroidales bacterium]